MPAHRFRDHAPRKPETTEDLFLRHWSRLAPHARRAARGRIPSDEIEDFCASFALYLVDDDFAVLRRCRDSRALGGYLKAVCGSFLLDFQRRLWGRWRPSAVARRLGAVAVELERLRDVEGMGEEEAIARLASDGAETEASLRWTAERLPPPRPRPAFTDRVDLLLDGTRADDRLREADRRRRRARVTERLQDALDGLEPADRRLLRLCYEEGLAVAAIARADRVSRRRLYTRRDRCLRRLGARLSEAGFSHARVARHWEFEAPTRPERDAFVVRRPAAA